MEYTSVNFEEMEAEENSQVGTPTVTAVTEKIRRKAPSIVGIRKKNTAPMETKAQREKRELQENLTRVNAGARESAAETEPMREQMRERNRELLRQLDTKEQERIIRDVLAEFLA